MATMSKRHPGRFGHIVAEIIQDIVGVGVVAINSTVLVIMAAVLAEYVPYKHFYHVVGNVVVYACLAAAIAVPFFLYITGVSDVRVHIPLLIMWGVVCDVLGY
ncbi:hypothetical protein JCM18920_1466 [Cutibacterium acnes JCM 18920]|nr:hypothetical protein JCM18920_1466 [Cutibacterium acnes JCM 18920]